MAAMNALKADIGIVPKSLISLFMVMPMMLMILLVLVMLVMMFETDVNTDVGADVDDGDDLKRMGHYANGDDVGVHTGETKSCWC